MAKTQTPSSKKSSEEELPNNKKTNPKRKNPRKRKSKDHHQLPDWKNLKTNQFQRKLSRSKSHQLKSSSHQQKKSYKKRSNRQRKKSTLRKCSNLKKRLRRKRRFKRKRSSNSKSNLRSRRTSWATWERRRKTTRQVVRRWFLPQARWTRKSSKCSNQWSRQFARTLLP